MSQPRFGAARVPRSGRRPSGACPRPVSAVRLAACSPRLQALRPIPRPCPIRCGPFSPTAPAPRDDGEEHCEFCATGIPSGHGHVADLEQSSLACACRACYLLFTASPGRLGPRPGSGTPGASPRRGSALPLGPGPLPAATRPGRCPPLEWDELQIPVGLAFFLNSSERGAWAASTRARPAPPNAPWTWPRGSAWRPRIRCWARRNPTWRPCCCAATADASEAEYFIVPIDVCYELAGRMRMLWKGFDGGSEARASIDEFLAGVRQRAREAGQGSRHG